MRRIVLPPRRRGIGQAAPCPSLEQLQGIIDPNDPCQQAGAMTAAGTPSAVTISPTGILSIGPSGGAPPATPSSIGALIQSNPLLFIGGALIAVMVIASMGKR